MTQGKAFSRVFRIVGGAFDLILGILGGLTYALVISLMATHLYRVYPFPLPALLGVYFTAGIIFLLWGIWKRAYFRLIAIPLFVLFAGDDSGETKIEWRMAVAMICPFSAFLLLMFAVVSKNTVAAIVGFLIFVFYAAFIPRKIEAIINSQSGN